MIAGFGRLWPASDKYKLRKNAVDYRLLQASVGSWNDRDDCLYAIDY